MKDVVLVDAVRTAQGNLGGKLRLWSNPKLGKLVIRALIDRNHLNPAEIDEVILGCVLQQSDATNVARVSGLLAGISHRVPAFTVSRNCASGLQAVVSACQMIRCEEADVVIAGGVECMSAAPFINRDIRFGKKLRHSLMIDSLWEGLTDPICNQLMGETAENLALEFQISRKDQDAYSELSHQRAFCALRKGKFRDEIIDVPVSVGTSPCSSLVENFCEDEGINGKLTKEKLAQYPPIFRENGTVTAGNSCPVSDGASAVLVMSADKAQSLGLEWFGKVRGYAFAGVEPHRMGIGPVYAVPLALKRANVTLADIELIELNEAFAVQALACEELLKLNRKITNVNGGAIALGHPVGATGVRVLVSLLHEMRRRRLGLGMITLCVGGGQGGALIVEM